MWLNRRLCRLCKCPVVDGGVQASQIDLDKFDEWCLKYLGTELADDLFENDVFCNFCVWDADRELSESNDSGLLNWWPTERKVDNSEAILKSSYLDGKVAPCWVKLEEIYVPKTDETDQEKSNFQEEKNWKQGRICIYCGKQCSSVLQLWKHMQMFHKDNSIRCSIKKCATYFHSLEERKVHIENVHEKRKMFQCTFCSKVLNGSLAYRQHVKNVHLDANKCTIRGCFSYFHTKDELNSHFTLVHKETESLKKFKCQLCSFKSIDKYEVKRHFVRLHSAKTIKCEKCTKMFPSMRLLKFHNDKKHRLKV